MEKRWSKKPFFCRWCMNWSIHHSISGYRHCIDDLWSMGSFQYLSIRTLGVPGLFRVPFGVDDACEHPARNARDTHFLGVWSNWVCPYLGW
jgi:hypothetical protein